MMSLEKISGYEKFCRNSVKTGTRLSSSHQKFKKYRERGGEFRSLEINGSGPTQNSHFGKYGTG